MLHYPEILQYIETVLFILSSKKVVPPIFNCSNATTSILSYIKRLVGQFLKKNNILDS
jgi:hypothetical protein